MKDLKFEKLEEINGGSCAVAVVSFLGSLASLVLAPATGGASLVLSQGMIVASTYSMGTSCSAK
ncbi:hypothetical protein [Aquimarina sp. AU474]|uniref:hypothetical protein n=1 Tax=Aquimarina sp. AU474 TaxID=2108529 RepID=UPI000D68BF52|nr:hypothetical protein [Aquimarina sp. AU474]